MKWHQKDVDLLDFTTKTIEIFGISAHHFCLLFSSYYMERKGLTKVISAVFISLYVVSESRLMYRSSYYTAPLCRLFVPPSLC